MPFLIFLNGPSFILHSEVKELFMAAHLYSFFPRLISAIADWMSAILAHMVWPSCEFKMQV